MKLHHQQPKIVLLPRKWRKVLAFHHSSAEKIWGVRWGNTVKSLYQTQRNLVLESMLLPPGSELHSQHWYYQNISRKSENEHQSSERVIGRIIKFKKKEVGRKRINGRQKPEREDLKKTFEYPEGIKMVLGG